MTRTVGRRGGPWRGRQHDHASVCTLEGNRLRERHLSLSRVWRREVVLRGQTP